MRILMKPSTLVRKPLFWFSFAVTSGLAVWGAVTLYPKAFPIVALEIQMDRGAALKQARALAERHQWLPTGKFYEAVTFDLDDQTQTYVELAAGGARVFESIMKNGLFAPYTWVVRHYREGQVEESFIRFTPEGKPYGFSERLREDAPGAAMSVQAARRLAEERLREDWGVRLDEYRLADTSQETKPGKRVDHTIVFERKNETVGEGRFRLRAIISGDRLTELTHYVKVPESFQRRYAEMRSANETITSVSTLVMILLYFVGGCGLGLFFLGRKGLIVARPAFLFALIVAGFQFLESINKLPLTWMTYDTALPARVFLANHFAYAIAGFLGELFMLTISFMAAETLSRKAFPRHPQLWQVWRRENASTTAILGRTLGGYLSVGFFFLFVVCIYWLGTHKLGWWNRSEALYEPNILASYLPWLTSLSNSLHAGAWEECLFRAVPLAGAALLGNRFGRRKLWIGAAFVLQAVIFAAAHANYMTQPAYARVIELILPSFMFGSIFLLFGLLPGILLHFIFDVVAFAIPLFATSAPGIWLDRALLILLSLIPLWIVLFARWKTGRWNELKKTAYNGGWSPSRSAAQPKTQAHTAKPLEWNARIAVTAAALSVSAIGLWAVFATFGETIPSLRVSRSEAITRAREVLANEGIKLSPEWEPLAAVDDELEEQDRFVWQTGGPGVYRSLVPSILEPPLWLVRFVRWNADVNERAEEYQVFVMKSGEIFRIRHEIPEDRPMSSLGEKQAQELALQEIQKRFGLRPAQLKLISSEARELPKRKDWMLVFQDLTEKLPAGEARVAVRISGQEPVASRRMVHVPEEWSRQQRGQAQLARIVRMFSKVLLAATLLIGLILGLIRWSRKTLDLRFLYRYGAAVSAVAILEVLNDLPESVASYSTSRPFSHQLFSTLGFSTLGGLLSAFVTAVSLSWIMSLPRPKTALSAPARSLLGTAPGLLICATLTALLAHLGLKFPAWGNLDPASKGVPFLAALPSVVNYTAQVTLLLLVHAGLDRLTNAGKRRPVLAWGALLLASLAWASPVAPHGLFSWAISGLTFSLIAICAYWWVLRHERSLIPWAPVGFIALRSVREISRAAYPGAAAFEVLSLIGIIFVAAWLSRRLAIGTK